MTAPEIQVTVLRATPSDRVVLDRLLALYLHDLSPHTGADLDEQGRFVYPFLDRYWTEAGRHAFLIRADGRLAGLALANTHVHLADSNWAMAEFFVARRYRRQGIGQRAAQAIFAQLPGWWEVGVQASNTSAEAFWRAVLTAHTGHPPEALHADTWAGLLFQFRQADRLQPPHRVPC
ncbi:MAG: GNAT family N-acetyltransferase [Bacteroidota bacterium]